MRVARLVATVCSATLLVGCTTPTVDANGRPSVPSPDAPAEWQLVWEDRFETDGLPDSTRWAYDVGGHGWGNQELQYYTEHREENARVEDGRLIIEAHREEYEGRSYTSARLVTRGKAEWTYGRVEVRARLPGGRGTWPAIWMLPTRDTYGDAYWPDNGEIDIVEHVGHDPDVVHSTVHTSAFNHLRGTQRGASIRVPTARTEFHVYAVEWTSTSIRAFVDDEPYFHFSDSGQGWREWPFDQPFHLILNIAVGGSWGGAEGVDEEIWPQRMEVESVRVYQR